MIVKILFVQDTSSLEKYLKEKQGPGNPLTEHDTTLEGMAEDYRRSQRVCKQKGNEAIHIIQSWSPKESATLTPEVIHKMGEALINRFAPGHAFVLETHTDEEHAHNHIVLNPVNPETKKRIKNKKEHLHTLRGLNDAIAQENGLSVLPPQLHGRRQGTSEKVRRIDAYRGRSYILDLVEKASFARAHATSYAEYGAILSAFDIQVRVEDKNITYFYPGKNHGKRGKNLDASLDKPSLEKQFAVNQDNVARNPAARRALSEWVSTYESSRITSARSRRSVEAEGPEQPIATPQIASSIPESELARAKTQNLIEYCRRTGIELVPRDDGGFALKGRDHVHLTEHSWVNKRNRTRGTIADFVAIHQGVGYLEAVAAVNQNPRLLALREVVSESARKFQSFYVPRGESASRDESLAHLGRLLRHPKSHPIYPELLKRQQAWVGKDGTVTLLPERGRPGAIEYRLLDDGEPEVTYFSGSSPFLSRRGKSDCLQLFVDPRMFLKRHSDIFINTKPRHDSLLVLITSDPTPVIAHFTQDPKLKYIEIADPSPTPEIQNLADKLRASLNPFEIDISCAWDSPAVEQKSGSEFQQSFRSQDFGIEREIPFHRQEN